MKDVTSLLNEFESQNLHSINDTPNTREKCLEIASKLRSSDGGAMTASELLGTAERLLNFINK